MRLRHTLALAAITVGLSISAAQPRYIFYMIGDGMGHGQVQLGNYYKTMVLKQQSLNVLKLPVASFALTYSASSPVTDSAAGGTALATGHKTYNNAIAMLPDSVTPVKSIARVLHDNGYGVGLVTTVSPDDATPAVFYANQPHRGMSYEIGCDAARSGYEFIGGANMRGTKDKDGKTTDLMKRFADNGVKVVRGIEALRNTDARKVLVLNTDSVHSNDVGFRVDSLPAQILNLPDLTRACISHLERTSPEKFFMMIEGGSIDHASHSNDPAAAALEMIDFDNTIGIVTDFMDKHPGECLLVITADHETGGLTNGCQSTGYDMHPDLLKYSRMSRAALSDKCYELLAGASLPEWDSMKQLLRDNFGLWGPVEVSDDDSAAIQKLFDNMVTAKRDGGNYHKAIDRFSRKATLLVSKKAGVGWTTEKHTGNPVPVFASGEGSSRFGAVMNNSDIPRTIMKIAGIDF